MKIHKMRLGFATNSSSTHSIVLFPKPVTNDTDGTNFGWNYFTASDIDAKMEYLAGVLADHFRYGNKLPDEWASKLAKKLTGAKELGDVDHQSRPYFPVDRDGVFDGRYFAALKNLLSNPNVAILGGNDNSDDEHYLISEGTALGIPVDYYGDLIARYDENEDYWTLFDPKHGTKLRVRMNPENLTAPITRASAPELVDVKITDYCEYGCKFCYQGSTKKGKHADFSYLRELACALGNLETFEVAIGGGEPTKHPQFVRILEEFKHVGVVPNFTTANLDWFFGPLDEVKRVMGMVGGIGFSVRGGSYFARSVMQKLSDYLKANNLPEDKITLHYVMGSEDEDGFKEFIRQAAKYEFPVLLLAYKNTGRGKNLAPHDYSKWGDWLKDLQNEKHYCRISIDTPLAAESGAALEGLWISKQLYETEEGEFSCYIDAVTQTLKKSSYNEEEGASLPTVPYDPSGKKSMEKVIRTKFQKL